MREIKFRAWDKINKEYIDYIWIAPEYAWAVMSDNDHMCERGRAEPHQFVLEQYTGLKDKNGKDIYEGDIVKAINPNGEHYGNFEITTYQDVIAVEVDMDEYDHTAPQWAVNNGYEFEVIGNIHENPELLEEVHA